MERSWLKNPVYRSIEGQARGLLPVLPPEAFVSFLAGLAAALVVSIVWAIACGLMVLVALFTWRILEHDRSDYFLLFWRRHHPGGRRCYNACGPDEAYKPPFQAAGIDL